ncbi:MAG: membrane protein insertase YidC [Clostridia bacterium]|nr:membrane protein insertase YidC [Clostridia bacterium]
MDIINKPLGWVLGLCSKLTGGDYLFAILIFAVIVEIVLLPFGISQQKKSIKQARLRPKELAIRKKYAGRDDRPTQMKMNEEIQELYQKEGYNPLGGCLPLLIQFPLLIALYNVVINPLKYICGLSDVAITQIKSIVGGTTGNHTMGLLTKISDKGYDAFRNVEGFTEEIYLKMPSLTSFGVFDLSRTPQDCLNGTDIKTLAGWLVILVPVVTFIAYFLSMKLTRKLTYQPVNDANQAAMGCSNKAMDIVMPLFSVFLAFTYPAALGLYWIFKCLLGMLKQFILSKAMPLPVFTDEDYKNAEAEVNARAEKKGKVAKSGRVVRSLHHIDDEDFEDTAEKARQFKEALAAQEAADKAAAEEARKNSRFGGMKVKDESDKPTPKKDKEESEEAKEEENADDGEN